MASTTSNFRPWRKPLLIGLVLIVLGIIITFNTNVHKFYLLPSGLGLILIGFLILKQATIRMYGKIIERKAIGDLLAVSKAWEIKVEPNIMLYSGGDLDVLITNKDDTRFAVEIKSNKGLSLQRNLFTGKEKLIKLNHKKLDRDPCHQVISAAKEVKATPILWLPTARKAKTIRMKSGVVVVQGKYPQLRKTICAGNGSWWKI
jgi:hypothetical protein